MTDYELLPIADNIKDNAYSPYSNIKVGAALLTAEGKVFTGVNVENSSFGATVCAERSAVVSAVSAGYRDFVKICNFRNYEKLYSLRNLPPVFG